MADNLTSIEIEATEMALELTCMDAKLYNAAFEGDIHAFQQGIENIELLLTPNKNTVLHIHFTAQSEALSTDFVARILNLCPELLQKANAKGETPLHIAARYGHSAAVEILMEYSRTIHGDDSESGVAADKKILRETNIVGDSALHEAVRYNHIQVVKLLTKEDPDYPYFANDDGETPLYIAIERYHKDVMLEILKNCKSPAYGGPDDRTALHAAVIRRDQGTLHMLVSLSFNHFLEIVVVKERKYVYRKV